MSEEGLFSPVTVLKNVGAKRAALYEKLGIRTVGDLLRFLQEAFGKGTELSMAVNDLTVAPVATAFLGQFLSTDYFAASRDLLLHRQSEQLLHQIDLTGLV